MHVFIVQELGNCETRGSQCPAQYIQLNCLKHTIMQWMTTVELTEVSINCRVLQRGRVILDGVANPKEKSDSVSYALIRHTVSVRNVMTYYL